MTFNIVDKPYLADFNVYWAKTQKKTWGRQIRDEIPGSTLKKKAVVIGIINGETNCILNDEDVYHIILHEFGHLLGLGHSYCYDDVMSYGPYHTKLSENDIFVLKLLYSMPYNSSYSDVKDYILDKIKNKNCTLNQNEAVKTTEEKDLKDELDKISEYKKHALNLTFQIKKK